MAKKKELVKSKELPVWVEPVVMSKVILPQGGISKEFVGYDFTCACGHGWGHHEIVPSNETIEINGGINPIDYLEFCRKCQCQVFCQDNLTWIASNRGVKLKKKRKK